MYEYKGIIKTWDLEDDLGTLDRHFRKNKRSLNIKLKQIRRPHLSFLEGLTGVLTRVLTRIFIGDLTGKCWLECWLEIWLERVDWSVDWRFDHAVLTGVLIGDLAVVLIGD